MLRKLSEKVLTSRPPDVGFIKWYHKAAEHGNVSAQLRLGHYYLYGLECADGMIEKNADMAVHWYSMAAGQNSSDAMFKLGEVSLGYASGMEEDKEKALSWFRKAAELGDRFAKEYADGLEEKLCDSDNQPDKPFSLIALLRSVIVKIQVENHKMVWPVENVVLWVYHDPGNDFTVKISTKIIREIFLALRRMTEKDMLMPTCVTSRDEDGNTYKAQPPENVITRTKDADYFGLLAYRPFMSSEVGSLDYTNDHYVNLFYTQPQDASGRFDPGGVEECTFYFADRAITFKQSANDVDKHETIIKVGKYLPFVYGSLIDTVVDIYRRQYPVITKEKIGELWD